MDTVKIRDIKLRDHKVSQAKYRELQYFCRQYEEKKLELKNSYSAGAFSSGRFLGIRSAGSPTERTAIRNVTLQKDIQLIEETAREAGKEVYSWLLKNVTQGLPFEFMDVPMGRRQFYELRRYFFLLLAQRR